MVDFKGGLLADSEYTAGNQDSTKESKGTQIMTRVAVSVHCVDAQ